MKKKQRSLFVQIYHTLTRTNVLHFTQNIIHFLCLYQQDNLIILDRKSRLKLLQEIEDKLIHDDKDHP